MGKRKNKIFLLTIFALLCSISAFALLKTGVFGNEKNFLAIDGSARYDIVADLDGGKFEVSAKPEFVKMDNGKWLHKYKPSAKPVKLPTPVKDGYEFVGWIVEDDAMAKPEYSIPVWNKKNINLRAEWRVKESVLLPGPEFNIYLKKYLGNSDILGIKFVNDKPDFNGIDLSEKRDNSIMGIIKGGVFEVACEGTIYANPNSSKMFMNFKDSHRNARFHEIIFENFDTSRVTDMSDMFRVCYNFASTQDSYEFKHIIGLNKFDTSNVTDMSGMFAGCAYLENLDLSSFDTSKVIDMSDMFMLCAYLEDLNISNFNTANVVDMCGMFATRAVVRDKTTGAFDGHSRSYLKTINGLEKFDTSKVTNMCDMFTGCEWLSGEITISNPNTDIYRMFFGCSKFSGTLFLVKGDENVVLHALKDSVQSGFLNVYPYNEKFLLCDGKEFNSKLKSLSNFEQIKHIKFVKDSPKSGINLGRLTHGCNTNRAAPENSEDINPDDSDSLDIPEKDSFVQQHLCNPCAIKGNIEGDTLYISAVGNGTIQANSDCSGMFEGMLNIESITFENFDTSRVTNMVSMFEGCTKLQNLDLSGFDTSRVENMKSMFFGCNKLDSVNLSRFNTSNVTSMQAMFGYCYTLNTLDLSDFNTSKVTNMHQMFSRCGSLKSINGIEKFDLSNVTDTSMMFQFCKNLSGEITIPSVITTYNQMFHGCSSNHNTQFIVKYTQASKDFVKELLKPDLNNKAKHVYLYEDTYTLRSGKEFNDKIKTISEFNAVKHIKFVKNSPTGGVNLGEDNYNVDKDTGLDLPTPAEDKCLGCAIKGNIEGDTLYISAVGSGSIIANPDCSGMFEGMSNIESITFENFDMSSITNMSRMFKNCSKLSGELTIDKNIASYQEMFFGCSSDTNAEFWVKYVLPETKNVAKNMVATKREGVDHVYLYESNVLVSGIEFNNILKTHFQNNGNGIKIVKFVKDIPKPGGIDFSDRGDKSIIGNLENDILIIRCATQIEANPDCSNMFNPFYNNYMPNFGLGGIEFDNFYTQNVVNMESMFEGLYFDGIDLSKFNTTRVTNMSNIFKFTGFINLDLTSFDTSKVIDMSGMFEDSEDLKAINLSSFDTSKVIDMSGMFSGCYMLNELRLENFNTQNVKSMKAMFSACESLTNLDLHTFNTSNVTDISYMFSSCSKLQNLNVSNFNTRNVIDMKSVFGYCKKLISLDLSNWDTGNVKYMNNMFDYCLDLKTIGENNFTFKNVTDMSYMFRSCNNLTGKIIFDFPDIPTTGGFAPHVSCEYMFNSCSTNSETQFIIDYTNNYSRFVAEYVAGGGNVKIRDRYRITYDFDGGSFMDTKRYNHYYSYEGLILSTPYKEGYNFIGWTGSNGSVPQENVKIKIGETGDKHYIANWELRYSGSESPNVFTRFKSSTKTQSAKPVKLTLINGPSAQYPKQVIEIENNKIPNLNAPDLNPKYAGQFGGYYYDEQFTKPVKTNDIITRDLTIYARW